MAREAVALGRRGRHRGLAPRRARAAGQLPPGARRRRGRFDRVRGRRAARGAAGPVAHSRWGVGFRRRRVPLLRQHPRIRRGSAVPGGRSPARQGDAPRRQGHQGVRPGGSERGRFHRAARGALRDRGEPALHRRDGAGGAGVRAFAVRRACAGMQGRAAGVRPCGRPASHPGSGRQGDRVRAAPQRLGRHAVLALGPGCAGYLAAGDSLRAARADLHDLRAWRRRRGLLRGARAPRRPVVSRCRAPRGAERMTDRTVANVTCLGCGCACDDISVVVTRDRIAEARNACALGAAWFGDWSVPAETRVNGRSASLEQALTEAARLLTGAKRPLVYLAGDVSCETQRESVAIADRLHAAIDSLAATAAPAVLAAQRRGRAGATLGEIRQRADLVVFWAVDPSPRYPRYASRYAVEPRGVAAPQGRASRTLIAVDVGERRGPVEAHGRLAIAPVDEVDSLEIMRAVVQERAAGDARFQPAIDLARRMTEARYAVIVAYGEPSPIPADPARAEALVTLAQALNGPTRCALSTLRGGGNRSGADAVLTWQTGFPFAVDFARGYPSYQPQAGAAALLDGGEVDAALIIGTPASLPEPVAAGLSRVRSVVIGPRASAATFQPAVAVDTGEAGIHEGGTAFRMDDVPLPLRPSLEGGVRAAFVTVRTLRERMGARA